MRMTAWAAGALVGLLAAGPAVAGAVDAADPQGVLAAIRTFGHKARLDVDEEGRPVIQARAGDIGYAVQFYGCDGVAGCRQLQLAAAFDLETGLSPSFANAWNEKWAIGRLSVDEAGDPIFTYFLVTEGGLSPETFQSVLAAWSDALAGVVTDIGY